MKIHFIAIGESAMHNLALALDRKNYTITGSDDIIFEPFKNRLAKKGLSPLSLGWFPEKINKDLDAVILGMHTKLDNPELLRAKELGLQIYSYPEFLYEQSKNKSRVVIGGSYGKTTIAYIILHVLNYNNKEVDYVVGVQLEGFDQMVQLTEHNDFIILEGDEYLYSPIDRSPKFHLYRPNIALLSGIAWDCISVFPTYKNCVEQFKIFIDSIVKGGSVTYNEEDLEVKRIVEASENIIRKLPYHTPEYTVENGQTFLETPEGAMPIEIFGKHNLSNLAGAKWICQNMGVDEEDFYEAIATFKGVPNRLEKIAKGTTSIAYKDFAHSPAEVVATIKTVKEQYKNKKLLACLELHSYSGLNAKFLKEYKNTLIDADIAVVFYSAETVKAKQLEGVTEEHITEAFKRDDLKIFTDTRLFRDFIFKQKFANSVLLLMGSRNYGGLDFDAIKEYIVFY